MPAAEQWLTTAAKSMLGRFLPPVLVFAVVKSIGFGTFMWLVWKSGSYLRAAPDMGGGARPWDVLGSWDGRWYQMIARLGYHPALVPLTTIPAYNPSLRLQMNSAAFFPLYPLLMRVVSDVTGLGLYGAGMAVSVTSSLVAAAGIYAIAERLAGRRAGIIAAAIWAVFPGSGAEWAVYTESVYVALAAWTCYCLMTRRWLTAGLLAFAAGLNRPTALALAVAIGVAGLFALRARADGWVRPVVATLLAPLGTGAFVLWVGLRMHHLTGYFTLEWLAWGDYFGAGLGDLRELERLATGQSVGYPTESMIGALVLAALPLLIAGYLQLRPPLWLTAYALLTVAFAIFMKQNIGIVPRFILPAFPLVIGPAAAMRKTHWLGLAIGFAVLAIAAGWYAGYVMFELGVP
ncbi:MAG: hypothetical protein ACYCVZ_10960 [Streptosporangiaceae bacterium]